MIKVDVTLDNNLLQMIQSQLNHFTGKGGGKIAPGTKTAFDMATKVIQKSWQNWAKGGSIEGARGIKNASARLASSVKIVKNSDFDADIGTDSPQMERIQNGTPEYDMKQTYPYGNKSRVSKKRIPYLIIPFRWATPNKNGEARAHFGNTIPQDVYKFIQAKKLAKSVTTGETHLEKNYKGQEIERQEYIWGDRLKYDGNMDGMVKMSAKRHATYFTFRIISAKSPARSWIRKEIPANNVIQAIEKTTRPIVEDLLDSGIRQDLGV